MSDLSNASGSDVDSVLSALESGAEEEFEEAQVSDSLVVANEDENVDPERADANVPLRVRAAAGTYTEESNGYFTFTNHSDYPDVKVPNI